MLHMHFDFLERSPGASLLTDEHDEMIVAIAAKDVDRADALAHAHTRQFRDNFIDFMKENYATAIDLGRGHAA
jgi:DNA-binding GntR family transcriptional regulator